MTTMLSQSRTTPVAAFVFMALGATGLTLGDFFIKLSMSAGVSIATLLIFAWPVTVILLVIVAYLNGGVRHHLSPHNPRPLFVRTVLLLVMSWLNITSLSLNPYAQHAMLFQLSPVFALIIGVVVFDEAATKRTLVVLLACLLGTWLVLKPGPEGLTLTLLFAVAAAFMNSVTNAFIAAYNKAATALGYTFFAVCGVAIVAGPYWLIFEREFPAVGALLWIQLSAVFAVTGLAFVGRAFILASQNVGKVSTMLYIQIPVAVVLGWVVFGDAPPMSSIVGSVIIVVAGMSVSMQKPKITDQPAE